MQALLVGVGQEADEVVLLQALRVDLRGNIAIRLLFFVCVFFFSKLCRMSFDWKRTSEFYGPEILNNNIDWRNKAIEL